jgi:hypothetical protein
VSPTSCPPTTSQSGFQYLLCMYVDSRWFSGLAYG